MSTSIENKPTRKIIHVGALGNGSYLLLRKEGPHEFRWWIDEGNVEKETPVSGTTVEQALRSAHMHWKNQSFRTLICGFRYTLPERDEHGMNALFHQMVASYSNPTGIYQDEELGHNCHVQFASDEAIRYWKQLKTQNRLNG